MSVRLLTVRLVKHGRYVLRSYWNREIHSNILEQSQLKTRSKRGFPLSSVNVLRVSTDAFILFMLQMTLCLSISPIVHVY